MQGWLLPLPVMSLSFVLVVKSGSRFQIGIMVSRVAQLVMHKEHSLLLYFFFFFFFLYIIILHFDMHGHIK